MDHLSSMDAAFLHFETPETPMHVGSLEVLELPKGYQGDFYEDAKAYLKERQFRRQLYRDDLRKTVLEAQEALEADRRSREHLTPAEIDRLINALGDALAETA